MPPEGSLGFGEYAETISRAMKKIKTPAQRARAQRKRQKRRQHAKAACAASR